IFGLRGNNDLEQTLDALENQCGIVSIEASSITGNILVFYDPERELSDVIAYLESSLRQPAPARVRPSEKGPEPRWSFLKLLRGLFTRETAPELSLARRDQAPRFGREPERLPE